jgi:hypothetical protein
MMAFMPPSRFGGSRWSGGLQAAEMSPDVGGLKPAAPR